MTMTIFGSVVPETARPVITISDLSRQIGRLAIELSHQALCILDLKHRLA